MDFIYIPMIIIAGLMYISRFTASMAKGHSAVLRKLFFFHLLIGVYYAFFLYGDANRYYNVSKVMTYDIFIASMQTGEGTKFMEALNFPFSKILGMPYLSNTLFFSLVGFIGITLFYKIALELVPYNVLLFGITFFPTVFFLPNLHVWSVSIGKDTILFLCIAMFSYGLLAPSKRIWMIVFAILLGIAIRPHIVLFLFVGFGLAYVFGGKIPIWQRVVFSAVMLGAGLAILPSVLEFANIEAADTASFEEFAASKSSALGRGNVGSAIDVSSLPVPLQWLTFWFRPSFFDGTSVASLLTSVENLILLCLFVMILMKKPYKAFKAAPFVIKGLVLFAILGTLAFAPTLGNLGIMIRMRNMFLPGMLIFLLWVFSYHYQTRILKKKKK